MEAGIENFESDQGLVWEKVSAVAANYSVESETESLNEVFKNRLPKIDSLVEKINYVKNATGVALFFNGEKISIDLFQHPDLMKANWNNLIRSAVMDLYARPQNSRKKKLTKKELNSGINNFFKTLLSEAREPKPNPGGGVYLPSRNDEIEVGTLIDGNTIAHLSGFSSK
jgi:hypothetical protein